MPAVVGENHPTPAMRKLPIAQTTSVAMTPETAALTSEARVATHPDDAGVDEENP